MHKSARLKSGIVVEVCGHRQKIGTAARRLASLASQNSTVNLEELMLLKAVARYKTAS